MYISLTNIPKPFSLALLSPGRSSLRERQGRTPGLSTFYPNCLDAKPLLRPGISIASENSLTAGALSTSGVAICFDGRVRYGVQSWLSSHAWRCVLPTCMDRTVVRFHPKNYKNHQSEIATAFSTGTTTTVLVFAQFLGPPVYGVLELKKPKI